MEIVIHTYTREQAIEDGVLVDVTETADEAGFLFPMALTHAVWSQYVHVPDGVTGQDEQGRLWDILWMLRVHVLQHGPRQDTVFFSLHVRQTNEGAAEHVQLKCICGPGDAGEPVLTVLLPNED